MIIRRSAHLVKTPPPAPPRGGRPTSICRAEGGGAQPISENSSLDIAARGATSHAPFFFFLSYLLHDMIPWADPFGPLRVPYFPPPLPPLPTNIFNQPEKINPVICTIPSLQPYLSFSTYSIIRAMYMYIQLSAFASYEKREMTHLQIIPHLFAPIRKNKIS